MLGPTGILDQLPPEQQDELFDLLNNLTIMEVLQTISAPLPGGWGISTHATSLRRFYQRKQVEILRSELTEKSNFNLSIPETAFLKKVAFSSFLHQTFHSALSPRGEPCTLEKSLSFFLEIETLARQRERLKIDLESLNLEKDTNQFQTLLQSAKMRHSLLRAEFDHIMKVITDLLRSGRLDPEYWRCASASEYRAKKARERAFARRKAFRQK